MKPHIPYGRQNISSDDIKAVTDVLQSDWITQGDTGPRFEHELAAYCGADHAVAVNSATSALHIACLALGLKSGDRLWTTPITFVASANVGLYCNASVDFVDIDDRTFNICPKKLERKLEQAKRNGQLPSIVIVVHLAGQPCEMDQMLALKRKYGFHIIEDASHALGAIFQETRIGCCAHSDIAVFSFHPVKMITTAEGGAATTNCPDLAQKMRLFRTHGITKNVAEMENEPEGDWYYEQTLLGFNYRMSDVQAALGLSQLTRLDHFLTERRSQAARYDEWLQIAGVRTPWQLPGTESSWHLYIITLTSRISRDQHKKIFSRLRESGIGVGLHYIPVYRQPLYQRINASWPEECPAAERYYETAISLPIFPSLEEDSQRRVVAALTEAIEQETSA